MDERIAYWIRTPQIPGSRPGWYGTFYWASDCWPPWQHQVERSLVCVEGRGRISRSGLTQDIKMGSCVFQCDVPHRWIAQRQVGPVSVYCDGVGCRVLCLRHGISVWQHIGQSTTATSRHRRDLRCFKATLNPNKQNKIQRATFCVRWIISTVLLSSSILKRLCHSCFYNTTRVMLRLSLHRP